MSSLATAISTAPAPQAAGISAESIVLGVMLLSFGVLIGMAIAFWRLGTKKPTRGVVNLAGVQAAKDSRCPCQISCTQCTCGAIVNLAGPAGTPPDRRQ